MPPPHLHPAPFHCAALFCRPRPKSRRPLRRCPACMALQHCPVRHVACAPLPLWGSASRALCSHARLARSVLASPGPARLSLRRSDQRWLSDLRHLLAADAINRRASAPRRAAQRRRGPGSSPGGGPGSSRSLRRPHPVRDQGVRSLKLQGPSARPRPPRPARSHILRSAAAAALSLSLPALPSRAHRRRARAPPQAAGLTLVPVPLLRRQHPRSCGPHDQLPARAALAVARRLRRRLVRQGDEEHHQA